MVSLRARVIVSLRRHGFFTSAGHIDAGLVVSAVKSSPVLLKTVADPGENLTGVLHSKFGRDGCGGRD